MAFNTFKRPHAILRKELIRALLERGQGIHLEALIENEREINDPKGIYDVVELINIPYMNHTEVPLAMDIFKPAVPENQELPVIVNIHGGGLVIGDRKVSRRISRILARRGYLVFSIEYRLAPRANLAEQLDDICAGMDLVGERLVDFNVDFTRLFMMSESAGSLLAIYVAAMKESKALQEAIGYEPTRMTFTALGLATSMLYTNRNDPIGWLLSDQLYGNKAADPVFVRYMDPENPEILYNLPPTILVTSRGDFMNRNSLMYHQALKQAGRPSHLVYYGEKELGHSFVWLHPELPQSLDAIDRMTAWFEEQTEKAGKAAAARKKKAAAKRKPAAARKKPADAESKPADAESKPADAESKPADAKSKPADTESKPADAESKPAPAKRTRSRKKQSTNEQAEQIPDTKE